MRYVLLLLTLLTAGFSVWYYQNRISPEGKELSAQKTTLEQEAAILEKAVIQSRKKLDDAQDATRAAEEDIERFQQAYLEQKGSSIRKSRMPPTKKRGGPAGRSEGTRPED